MIKSLEALWTWELISWSTWGEVKGHGGLEVQCVLPARARRRPSCRRGQCRGGKKGEGEPTATQCTADPQTHQWPLTSFTERDAEQWRRGNKLLVNLRINDYLHWRSSLQLSEELIQQVLISQRQNTWLVFIFKTHVTDVCIKVWF